MLALEWLDPPVHRRPLGPGDDRARRRRSTRSARPGSTRGPSRWDELAAARPEVVVAMPCGLSADEAARAGGRPRRARSPGSGARARLPSTPPPPSRGPGRAWSTASSCSPTSSTPTASGPPAGLELVAGRSRLMGREARPSSRPRSTPPPELCFETIIDYETLPGLAAGGEGDRGPRARRRRAAARSSSSTSTCAVRKVAYTLDYTTNRPQRVWWDFVEGDGSSTSRASSRFEPRRRGTLATYRLDIEPGVPSRASSPAGWSASDEALGRGPEARGRAAR